MTAQRSLFALPAPESLPDGVFFLPNALTDAVLEDVVRALKAVVVAAPPQRTQTRGGGMTSAAMTNCGNAGWWSDRRGYRYLTRRPDTGGHGRRCPLYSAGWCARLQHKRRGRTLRPKRA